MVLSDLGFGVSYVYLWVSCVYLSCCRFALSVPQPSDWLERLIPKQPTLTLTTFAFLRHNWNDLYC